jgi:hypothetical protein
MKNYKYFLLFVFCVAGHLSLYAQSNTFLDEFLAQDKVTFGNAVYLVLSGAGMVEEGATVENAVEVLGVQDWGIKEKAPEEPISLEEYSYLLMRVFKIGGGFMYALFPSARYAFRELRYLGFIDPPIDPGRTLSGEEALRILASVLELKEGDV